MCSGSKQVPLWWIVMQLSVSMCVIGSLICNKNDKLHVILTIPLLQCVQRRENNSITSTVSRYYTHKTICNGILCFNNHCTYCNSMASKVLHYWLSEPNIDVKFLCVVCHAINTTLAKITMDASVLEQVQWSYIQLPPIENLVSYLPSYNRWYWSILSADRTMPHHHMPSTELTLLHDLHC